MTKEDLLDMNCICIANLPSEAIEWEVGLPIYKITPWMYKNTRMGTLLWYAPDGSFDPLTDGLVLRQPDGSWFVYKNAF